MKWKVKGMMVSDEGRKVNIIIIYLCSLVIQKNNGTNEKNIQSGNFV